MGAHSMRYASARKLNHSVSNVFLVRVAGLPLAATDALDHGDLEATLAQLHDIRLRLDHCSERLSERLYQVIAGKNDCPAAQKALLNIRRNVFNHRSIKDTDLTVAQANLSQDDFLLLISWQALLHESRSHEEASEQGFDKSMLEARTALKKVAR